jgi:hypothetical protein
MKPSLVRKAEAIEQEQAPKPRMRFYWWDLDETRDMVEARIRDSIARGEASPNDRCIIFTWRRPEE